MSLRQVLKDIHLVEDDTPPPVVPASPPPLPSSSNYNPASWQPSIPAASSSWQATTPTVVASDPGMVSKIKNSVFGASPVINQFMQNLDLVKPQFPNDESAAMRAALAFTRVDKNSLLGELNGTITAAIEHTKSGLENDHKRARDSAVGSLESQLSSINSDITAIGNQITSLQQTIAAKQSSAIDIQGKIRDADANIQQQDNVIKGSLAEVERSMETLRLTLSKL